MSMGTGVKMLLQSCVTRLRPHQCCVDIDRYYVISSKPVYATVLTEHPTVNGKAYGYASQTEQAPIHLHHPLLPRHDHPDANLDAVFTMSQRLNRPVYCGVSALTALGENVTMANGTCGQLGATSSFAIDLVQLAVDAHVAQPG